MDWSVQDAKKQLSRVLQKARAEGPQTVTLSGQRVAVVLSAEDYDALKRQRGTLVDALLEGQAWDNEFAEIVERRTKKPSQDAEN